MAGSKRILPGHPEKIAENSRKRSPSDSLSSCPLSIIFFNIFTAVFKWLIQSGIISKTSGDCRGLKPLSVALGGIAGGAHVAQGVVIFGVGWGKTAGQPFCPTQGSALADRFSALSGALEDVYANIPKSARVPATSGPGSDAGENFGLCRVRLLPPAFPGVGICKEFNGAGRSKSLLSMHREILVYFDFYSDSPTKS